MHSKARQNTFKSSSPVFKVEMSLVGDPAKDWQTRRDAWLKKFFKEMEDSNAKVEPSGTWPGVYLVFGHPTVKRVSVFMQTARVQFRDPKRPPLEIDFGARIPLGKIIRK